MNNDNVQNHNSIKGLKSSTRANPTDLFFIFQGHAFICDVNTTLAKIPYHFNEGTASW